MGIVNIEDISPGMVLDEDIRDHNGRFLLGKGLTIQDKHLRIFRIWGICQIRVQEDGEHSQSGQTRCDPALWEQARNNVLESFPACDQKSSLCQALVDIFTQCAYNTLVADHNNLKQNLAENEPDVPAPLPQSLVDPVSRLSDQVSMSSLPRIFLLIQEAIKDPRTSSKHIGEIISKDQALAACLLRLVNSAFYGFPSKVDTISRAVTIVGTRQLSTLALGISVISKFRNISPETLNMEAFWKHSIACAIGARTMAGFKNLPNSESFFVCGLLHDIGRLIMLSLFPEEYSRALSTARTKKIRLIKAEKIYFTHDHTYLGAMAARQWQLPLKIEQAIRFHEKPMKERFHLETTLVHMANILAIGCCFGSSGENLIPDPDTKGWDRTGLDPSTLIQTSRLVMAQVDNIYQMLFAEDQNNDLQ